MCKFGLFCVSNFVPQFLFVFLIHHVGVCFVIIGGGYVGTP